jgi:hypothetical protein
MMRTDGPDMQLHQPKMCISLLKGRHTWTEHIYHFQGIRCRRYQTHPKETQSDLRDGHAPQDLALPQSITVTVLKVVVHRCMRMIDQTIDANASIASPPCCRNGR